MEKKPLRRVRFDDLRSFCQQSYMKAGVPEEEADVVANLVVTSDLRGIETHGVTRLPVYIRRIQKGYVRAECQLSYLKEKGPIAFAEAHGSIGHVVAYKAMKRAIEKATEYGIGWVSVKDSSHFGATGLYSMMALEKDFIGYVVSNSVPMMAPFGGRDRMIGNNPISYAFPTINYPAVVIDFSCSVVAAGKLTLARKKGEKIPLGWAVDKNGVPTEDPYEGNEGGGTLSPMGAHKGYGLAVAHEMLTSILTGGKWARDVKKLDEPGPQGTCHSFMALDPEVFCGREKFKQSMDLYIRSVKESGKAKNAQEILMPGEPEFRTTSERLEKGIPLPPVTVDELTSLGQLLNVSLRFMEDPI